MENILNRYDTQFKQNWYDPYMQTALADPGTIMQGELMELGSGLPPEMAARFQADTGLGAPLVHTGQATAMATATEDLGGAQEDYMGAMDDLQTEEELLKTQKAEADKKTSIERGEFLRGLPDTEEARRAKIAQTGMAYSGPAERTATIGRGKEAKTLRDITEAQRQGQTLYSEKMKGIGRGREEAYGGYEEAEKGFGQSMIDMIQSGGSEINTLLEYALELPNIHQQYGLGMQTGDDFGTSIGADKDYKYGSSKGKMRDVVGEGYEGGFGAPQGGWFNEQATGVLGAGVPELQQAGTMLGEADDFARWLGGPGGMTPGEISNMMANPEWTDPSGEVYTPDDEG